MKNVQSSMIHEPHNVVYSAPLPHSGLIGPNNAGAKSALFLRLALIRAGVNKSGVKKGHFQMAKEHFGKIVSTQNQWHRLLRMKAFFFESAKQPFFASFPSLARAISSVILIKKVCRKTFL